VRWIKLALPSALTAIGIVERMGFHPRFDMREMS